MSLLPFVVGWGLLGAPAPETLPLTYEAALEAVKTHPLLERRRAHLADRTVIDRDLRGLALGPQVQALGGLRVSEGGDAGPDAQLSVAQGFYLSGVGAETEAAAQTERIALGALVEVETLELALAATAAWTRLWATTERIAVVERAIDLAERETRVLERAMQAGLRSGHELAEHRVHVEETGLLRVEAEGAHFEAEVELARTLAHRGPVLAVTGPLPTTVLPPEPSWPSLVERADRLPAVRAALLEAAAARQSRTAAQGLGAPVLSPTLMAQREAPDQWIGWAGVGVSFSGGLGQTRNLAGRADEAHAAERASIRSRLAARAELELALHEVEHARERLDRYDERVLPAARRSVELQSRAVEVGQGSVLDALRAQRRLLALELERVEAARMRAEAEARVGLFLGASTAEEEAS